MVHTVTHVVNVVKISVLNKI